jgi:hypothetical protein
MRNPRRSEDLGAQTITPRPGLAHGYVRRAKKLLIDKLLRVT